MNKYQRQISYPYAYGHLSAALLSLPNKLVEEAYKEGITIDTQIIKLLEKLTKQIDNTTHKEAADEYQRNGFLN